MNEYAWQRELEELTKMEARAQAILNVKPGASQEGLRTAYRRVARECHPDRNPGRPAAQHRFKDSLAAYRLLAEGARDRRLLETYAPQEEPDDSGYVLDNNWGYFLWWREKFF